MDLIQQFLATESPFAFLFVLLFIFHVKTARDRENDHHKKHSEQLSEIKTDLKLLVTLWKTLIEEEIKKRSD
jgi:hypothetical protein